MADRTILRTSSIFVFFTWVLVALPSSHSLTCKSLTFSKIRVYSNCSDLPQLDASLHYSYNSSNSSLSVAFTAVPEKTEGWISWAINPTSEGMIGAQALIAFKSDDGSVIVKPYNLTSYGFINQTKLSFDVWDMSAEANASAKTMTIFATVKVPEKAESLNQVWQVGPSVTNGVPHKHMMSKENLGSKSALKLTTSAAVSPAAAALSPDKAGESDARTRNLGCYTGLATIAFLWVLLSTY